MELIIDSFAGGGGASTAIEMALGRSPDIAINHDPVALTMHEANHPDTIHITENVWQVDIDDYARGKPVGLLWASPDCRHFSKARGGSPTSKSVRGLAWSIVKFCQQLKHNRPSVILMENVEEFRTWEDYDTWQAALKGFGYKIKEFELRACDFGAPTIRKRLFIVMRRDGRPIVEPSATHGAPSSEGVLTGRLKAWRTAAEIIDWSIPCPSIFDTSVEIKEKHGLRAVRPLADKTMARVAAGVKRYVLEAKQPFFVTYGQQGGRSRSAEQPLHTVCASKKDTNCIVVPTLMPHYGKSISADIELPIPTVTAGGGGKIAMVAAFLAQHNNVPGNVLVGRAATEPLSTVTVTGSQQAIVAAQMLSLKGTERRSSSATDPLATVCASGNHAALVSAFMVKYYGTAIGQSVNEPCHSVTTSDRFGLVTVEIKGESYVIVDIGMRMLTPRELFCAQGFPDDYEIDHAPDGTAFTKTQKVHKCGNSVSPLPAAALIRANCDFLAVSESLAA